MAPKHIKRSKLDSFAPPANCREESHRHLVTAMVQEVDVAYLASEVAKRIVPPVSEVLSVDELASQLVSKQRAQLITTQAEELTAELVKPSEA